MKVGASASSTRPDRKVDESTPLLQLLVVEDDATQRDLIGRGARQAGHAVTFATSVAEAVSQLQTGKFDCVTLDLMLEDGAGTEVLSAMADAKFKGAVIVISGMNGEQRSAARSHARSHGIELRSLPKPVDLSALRVCLADLTSRVRGLPAAHIWGGIEVSQESERHRSRVPTPREPRRITGKQRARREA